MIFFYPTGILLAFEGQHAKCPVHGDLFLGQIAPDTVFLDLEDRLRIQNDLIKRGGLIGRGAFGFVYEAVCRPRGIQTGPRNVALKMLQPISPGLNADEATLSAFEAAKAKWDRDPQQYASKSYCSARQELSVLIHLKHGHIVPLVGICVNPLGKKRALKTYHQFILNISSILGSTLVFSRLNIFLLPL